MDENRKKLYDQLSANYDMGTFDEFDTDLDNEDNQKVAWEAMGGQDGYGDFAMFQQAIARSPQAAEAGNTGSAGNTGNTGSADAATTAAAAPMMEAQQPDWATTASAMPGEEDADADISLPDAPNPGTPKDQSAGDREIVNESAGAAIAPAGDEQQERVDTVDYSTLSDDELMRNMGVLPGHELTQRDIDGRMSYIASIADPLVQQSEYEKLDKSIGEWNRRIERSTVAAREAAMVTSKKEESNAVAQLNENSKYISDEINATLKKDTDVDMSGTSEFTRAMMNDGLFKQFNDIIREIRSNIASWPDERLRQELTNRTFDNEADSMERAVYNVAIAKELEARSRGGHATTVGEDNFAEYIESLRAQDPQRARAIEAHADGYDIATRGHASSVQDHGDAALDDNPSYAVPRIAFELLKLRRAELSRRMDALKRGAPGGTTTAAIEAMGYSEMLTAEDYEACFRQAEELFGRDKIEGYNAQIMRRHDETMGEAVARYEREVMSTFMDIVSDDMRPKNNWEYVFGYIVHNNFGSRVLQALHGALHGAPKGLDFSTVYNSSVAQYTTANSDGAVNVAAQVFAPTATFLLGAGCIGEFFVPNIVGRWTSTFALRAVGGGTAAGMRSMAQKGIVKYGTSMLSTGTNFAAFGLQNELIHQLSTGDVEGVRLLVATLEEGLKGAAFGTATGIMGKLFERATGWKAYVGEAAKIGVEAAAFTGMGYLEARMNGKDGLTLADVGTNIGIVAGSKMSHFKQWSSEVRQRARNEGIYGRKVNYHEISEREREQLESLGYHGVAIALKGSLLSEDQARAIDAELSQMRNDKNVPWELVRCADWVLNGRMSVPPAVADARVDGDAVNGYVITAVDSTGRAIRGGVTVKGNDAKNDMVRLIKKEADVARYAAREQKMVEAQSARDQAMCAQQFCAMSDGKYTDVGVVLKIFGEALRKNDAKEKLGDVEEEVLTGVGVLLAKMDMSDIVGDRRKQTEQAYKVNLDKAIKKDASERTDAEKAAVKDYDAWLDTNKDLLNLESEQFAEWLRGAGTDGTSPWSSASGDTSAEARGWLTSWSDKIDTSDLVIVESIDQVADATVREAIKASEREGRKDVPGWSVGGKAYVYLPHIGDKADFDKTVMHELVAHRGLRGLLGENRFNDLCDRVWNSMSAADRARLWDYPSSELAKNERDRQRAVADEYIAQLSERTDAEGLHLWNKFVALLYEHLHVNIMGTGLDAQLREDIRESYRNLREGRDGGAADGTAEAERGGEGEPRKEDPIFEGEPEHIHEDKPDDGAVPPDDGGTPPPEGVAAPPAAEGGETPAASGEPPVERPTAAVGRVEGTPADLEDWRELMTLDPDELDSSQVTEGLSLLEAEREQAHRYAAGELADEPSNWEYWAARDGLSAPENPGGTPPVGGGGEPPVDGGATPPAGGEPPAGPERPVLSDKPLNELTAEELDGEITRLMEYFDAGGQDADGSLDRRLSELYAEQSRREEEVKEPRGPQPPETPTPPAEPTGDTAAADTATDVATERPDEVSGSADDQRMNDVLSAKLGEVDEEAERRAAQEADPYYMPMENKGGGRMSPNYRKATAEQIFNHLNDRENASGRDTLDGNIADGVKRAEDKVKAVERREPKGKGRSDTALDKWEKELSEARAQLEKWREVERMRQEQKAAEGDDSDPTWKQAYDAYTSSDEYPSSLEDYVARHLYGTKFKWKDKELERTGGRTHGLGGHLGLGKSEKERRGFFGWIDEKNGSYPESVAEGIHANMPDWMRDRYDTMEVLDAVLSVVGGNPRPRDMVVDYAKRLREQSRDMDEYYADEAAGARGFADAGEMDAYDNMREREATGFHDVAAAGREADGARADLLADARARLADPNASEFDKQAARAVLRFRQRGGQSTLQGLDGYTEDEVLSMVREDIEEKLADAGVDGVRINGMAIHGSRKRGDARSDSDLDVVVEYDGDISEDGLFNLLNDVPLTIEGVSIDINPITEGKSGTLAQYMERSRRYDASKTADRDIRFRYRDDERRPTFYSNAERAVENVKQGKATAEQWKAMLTKAGGIKAGEDKWMGLTDWLDEHKGQPLTKDEVLQFVRDNGIRMEEVDYGGDEQDRWRRIWDELSWSELYDTAVRRIEERGGDSEEWDNINDEIQDILTERYGEQVFDHIDYDSEGNIELKGNEIHSIREDYTTPGLENKREIAFVVPGIEPYQENDAVHFGPENNGRAVMWVRFGETTDKDGKRVLVIDEVQSNRHQDAREKGYRKSIEDYKKSGYRVERNSSNNGNLIYDKDGNFIELVFDNESPQGVPAAPFEKNWMEVAMKRMLRLAAEEGFDKVAWTTGMQQAERYDLGKMVDEIRVIDASDGVHEVMGFKDGERVFDRDVAGGERGLSELIGKDMARKAYSNLHEGRTEYLVNGTYVSLTGKDLSIGGEGMKGFYDQMLPRFMRKYVKKWGSQVGEVELATPGGEVMHSVDVTEPMRDSVMQGQPLFRIRGEHKTGDRVREKEEKGYRSLFDGMDDREEQSRPSIERERSSLKEQLARSSDEELLRKIGESSAEDRTFYSEEYDRRHLKEYNEMCDNYRKMLDDGKVEFEQAEEMLLDAIHDWREGHASAERTRLLAQFDTLNAYYAEKQEEAWEREDAEHDGPVESATPPRGGEQAPLPTAPTPTFDPTAIGLRQLTDGETSHVQRRYERSGQFDFTGSERIESADDVAYIFRNLENSAIENVFLILVKDGRGTILHVGMGDYRTSLGHLGAGYLAASELRPDKVVMVHNHPSGSLEPSGADLELHNKVVRMFGDDVVAPSIIIDTTRGEYSEFEAMADLEIKSRKRSSVGEIHYDTYTFSRQVFAPGYNPATAFTVRSSEDVAKFVSSHRLGERPKVSLIVLDNRNHVVGNVFLPYTELKAADASRASDETARYVHQMGGSRAILYGRVGSVDGAAVKSIKSALRDRDVSLVDFIDVNRGSYNDRGMLNEEGARYNSDVRFRVRDGRHGSAGIERPRGEHEAAVEEARRRLESGDASEFERTAARAVIKAYGGGSDDAPDMPGGGVRFRTRDDADMLVDMAKHNNEVARQRRDAVTDFVKAVTDVDELTDSKFATALGKVMRGQRQYDQATVADITTMVKAMMDAGLLTELDNFSVKQILTKVKDSTGKNDITAEANKLIDIMLKHQLRRGKRAFEQQLKVKGMRQDSRGVVVQGGLDYHGQRAAKALKEGLTLGDLQAVNDRIDEAEQRLSDPDEVVRGNAADELEGLYIARQYYDEIKQSEINEANIKSQLEQAQTDHKNGTLSDEAYKQLRQASNDALRELRCERVDAWARLNEQLGDRQSESAERAKQFREQQKQRQAEIQHWANSDMEGHSADPHEQETQKKSAGDKARDVTQAVLQPLGTFNKLMRYFGNAHPKGEGYLFGFVRRFMNVRDQWFKERKADFDQMDIAARRIGAAHGALVKVTVAGGKIATRSIKDWADVYTYINQQKPLTVTVKGKDYEITQGNAAYLLAMEGQADGRMKLRSMGLTEADMDALRGQVDPMLLELSDWVIHGLLPGMRPRLNQTHIRMFGADMTDIPNYFPIRTSELARNETVNLSQQNGKIRPATITGSIIERKRNNLDLDLGADFFQVTAEHIDEMNHWNSFAEFARDLNTLLSYKRFKAQVHNLHSLRYGNGADIWKTLEDTAAITTGDYQPKTSKADTIINGATKGLAAANITFRPYTGLKQLLSAPVYLVQARWDDIGYSLANLKDTWQWAIKNLPTFAERWQGRMAGDPILTQAEQERGSQNKKLRWLSKAGFAFNAYVDAVTVAIGARAIYRTKYRRYKDMGYSEEQANQKALEDASISVNETQQSGLGAFTSVIQQDRTFWSRALTIYRNASMGYQRQLVEGLKAMRNGVSAEWRATAREKVQKKLERDGIDSAMAAKVADRLANREAMRGLALAAMFGSIAPFVWALGMQYLGYKMAGGDDDEQEDKMLGQASTHLLSGWAEGIVFGGQLSSAADFAYDYFHGRKKLRDYSLQRDLVSDMAEQILGKSSGKPADAVYDIVNMMVAMSTGVNPKSIVEPTVGIIDVVQNWGGDAKLAHEVALGWCRLLNVPQTSLDQVYIDEIGLSAKDAKQLTAEQFAERWCRYKRRRGAGWMSALTSEESDKEQEGKLLKRYERMMDERFESLSDERVEQIMESDDELLKKHAVKAYKSRIDALSDDEVAAAMVPLSDSAPQDSVDVKREGIKRAYKSEGMSYDTPSDREKNAQAYERHATMTDIAEDTALKGRRDALKKSVGDEFEKMGAEYKKGSRGWGWYIPDSAKSRADEIHAYKKAHEAELDEYGILLKWFGSSKGSSGYIKKGFTDGKHDADEVMKEYREARKEVLAKTKQR